MAMHDLSHAACESCGLPHEGPLICNELRRRKSEIARLKNEVRLLTVANEKLRMWIEANRPEEAPSILEQMRAALAEWKAFEEARGERFSG